MPLYQDLLQLLDRGQWRDQRHLKTAVNMIVGLIFSSAISLAHGIPYAHGRAVQSQSVQRRFARWLDKHITPRELYAPLINEALQSWGEAKLYLALDHIMITNLERESLDKPRCRALFAGNCPRFIMRIVHCSQCKDAA